MVFQKYIIIFIVKIIVMVKHMKYVLKNVDSVKATHHLMNRVDVVILNNV